MQRSYDLFVSYRRSNRVWVSGNVVLPLRQCVNASGEPVTIFIDTDSLEAGEDWRASIESVVKSCRRFLAIWDDDFWRSPMCMHELDIARRQDPNLTSGFIVPVLHENCSIPEPFSRIQYISADTPDFPSRLMSDLGYRKPRSDGPPGAVYESPWGLDLDEEGRKLERISSSNLGSLQAIGMLGGHRAGLNALHEVPSRRLIVSAGCEDTRSGEHSVRVWENATGRCLRTVRSHHFSYINAIGVTRGGDQLIIAGAVSAKVDLSRGEAIEAPYADRARLVPGEGGVITLAGEQTIVRRNLESGEIERVYGSSVTPARTSWDRLLGRTGKPTFMSHRAAIRDLALTPDGKLLASKDIEGTLKLWDVTTGQELKVFDTRPNWNTRLAASPNGRFIMWENGLLDLVRGSIEEFSERVRFASDLSFSSDGTLALIAAADGGVVFRDAGTGEILHRLATPPDSTHAALLTQDQRRLFLGGSHQVIHDWLSEGIFVYGVLA